ADVHRAAAAGRSRGGARRPRPEIPRSRRGGTERLGPDGGPLPSGRAVLRPFGLPRLGAAAHRRPVRADDARFRAARGAEGLALSLRFWIFGRGTAEKKWSCRFYLSYEQPFPYTESAIGGAA